MAFNLNKNDETVKGNGPSKFDLSKSNTSTPTVIKTDGKSKQWLLATITIVLTIIISGWYLLSRPTTPVITETTAPVITPDSLTTVTAVTRAVTTPVASENTQDAKTGVPSEALANKTAVAFGKASATLNSIDQNLVNKIVAYLDQNPASSVTVNGYASSEGTLESNQYISQARAAAFKSYLVSKGITADRITAIAKGIEDPIASNDTEKGRRQNRRVTITFP